MPGDRLASLSVRVYQKLLLLYPREHRNEYGPLMLQAYRDLIRDAGHRDGVRGIVRVWPRTLWDLLVTVPGEHAMVAPKTRLLRMALCLLVGFAVLCISVSVARIPPHAALRTGKEVSAIALSPDGRAIVAGTVWGGMYTWDANTRRPEHRLTQSSPSLIYSLAFSPDGRLLASSTPCGPLGCVQLWDARTGELVRTLEGHARGVQVTDREGRMRVLDVPGDVGDVGFSPDGRLLASAGSDGAIELREVSTGRLVRSICGHNRSSVWGIAFSPDGRTLAASQEGAVLLWDVDSGHLVRELEEGADLVGRVAFSPDGHSIASGGADQTIRLWDVRTGQLLNELEQGARISSMAFSPDGRVLASGDWDNRVWLWDLESGLCLRTYRAHRWDPFDNGVAALAFSADGRTLVSGGEDGRVILWDVSDESLFDG